MATHSSILAWKIPWTEEPGRLQFMQPADPAVLQGHKRVIYNLATKQQQHCYRGSNETKMSEEALVANKPGSSTLGFVS